MPPTIRGTCLHILGELRGGNETKPRTCALGQLLDLEFPLATPKTSPKTSPGETRKMWFCVQNRVYSQEPILLTKPLQSNLRANKSEKLQPEHQTDRIFQALLHTDQESDGFFAIHNSVVIGQSEIHHRPDDNLTIHDNRTLLDLVHS